MWQFVAFAALCLAFWDGATTVMGVVNIFGNNVFGLSTGVFGALGTFAIIYITDKEEINIGGHGAVLGFFLFIVVLFDFYTSFQGNLYLAEYASVPTDYRASIMSGFLCLCMVASPVILRRAIRKMSLDTL